MTRSDPVARDPQPTHRASRGQATVELALALPLVVMLMLAVIQIGVVVRDRVLLAHVAREAARAAAVDPELAAASEAAREASGLDTGGLTVELDGGRSRGDRLTVRVSYLARTDVPVVGPLVPDIRLDTEVTIRVE